MTRGVFVTLWTIELDEAFDGWLVIEAAGSFDLSVDGDPVASRRWCGRRAAEAIWIRLRLDAGRHRFRADLAARGRPEIRASLFDSAGLPVSPVVAPSATPGPWAASEASVVEPPAMAAHLDRLDGEPTMTAALLAAAIAEQRRDAPSWRRWIERATELAPEDPWPRLARANFWLTAPTDTDREVIRRRIRDELRGAGDLPLAMSFERALALRERREEDADRLIEALVEEHGDDVRVIRMWISEALGRGWVREAEDGLAKLQAALPGSQAVAEVELEVLAGLERWQERRQLLRALAATEPIDLELVDTLADGCLVTEAIGLVETLRQRVEDPVLDVELVKLLYAAGELDRAAAELERIRDQWGALRVADELELAVTAGDRQANDRALDDALGRMPSSIELQTLSWRRGRPSFFEPYRVSVAEIAGRDVGDTGGVDAVLLLDQAVERVFADGSSLYYYHGVSRALTPVGARQAARLQQLPDSHRLKIRIHKPDGAIVVPDVPPTSGGVIELDEVEPGDLVEEEYVARVAATAASQRGHLPPYIYRFADSERAFGLSEYLLLVPPEIELLVEGQLDGVERSEWRTDGLRVIRWRAEDVPPITEERFAPPPSELLPWVSYGFGVSWADVGDALRDRLLDTLVSTHELDTWSASLLDGKAPRHALDALVNAVIDQIEPGRGPLDFSESVGRSFSRREGNRLGVVAAALMAADWQVDLVMSRTRPFAGSHLLVPTFDSFILPLLRVAHDGEELWIDIDEERQGVDRISPMLQGSDGLVIPLSRPGEPVTVLAELPTFANPDLEERMAISATLEPTGDGRVTVELPIRGPQAERVIEQIRSVPTDRVPLVYQQMAANFVPTASEVDGRIDRVDGGVNLTLEMRATGLCRIDGSDMVCRELVFSQPLAPVLASLPTRQYPLIMPVPVLHRNVLEITPPPGWTVVGQPRKIEAEWGSLVETIEHDGKVHRSVMRLELPAQTIEPDAYPAFARFCHALDELASRPPVLKVQTGGS
jgi:hypothetical protein